MKRKVSVSILILMSILAVNVLPASASPLDSQKILYTQEEKAKKDEASSGEISAPSAVLMEASTGKVIYDKNSHEKRHPASVTKVMTLLLIFDALKEGKLKLTDEVTVSEFAASMGGSQVFLEPGEKQTVDTMIKCISIASANDACVAMAEHLCGSEEEFVARMNERAKGLGMKDTSFVNCNGLDTDGHMTTAYDIALMSRELITKYPEVHKYCTVWMEDITHTTKKGSTQFTLTNTNKLIKQYQYATGLKTGSTSQAKYCVSATAKKDGIELIAVIMAAPDYKVRFRDATTLLNSGFGKCQLYKDEKPERLPAIRVTGGVKEETVCKYKSQFSYLSTTGEKLSEIKKEMNLKKELKAPVKAGDKIGEVTYKLGGKTLGTTDIIATETVKKAAFPDYLKKMAESFLM